MKLSPSLLRLAAGLLLMCSPALRGQETAVPPAPAPGSPPAQTTAPAAGGSPTANPPSPLEVKFREALFAEEAKQDLKTAAAAYQDIVAAFDRDRETAASALYRLAEVHRKESRTDEAIACFRRVAVEFPDREPLARMARENIRLLGGTVPELNPAPNGGGPPPVSADPEQDKALARLKEMQRTSPDLLLNPSTSLKSNGCISYDEAIQAGYQRAVAFFLEQGASPDLTPGGKGPLAIAAEYGQGRIIDLLLEKGADINGGKEAEVPLAAAARGGHLAIVQQLLDKGAKVNGRDDPGARVITGVPLVLAAKEGHKALMELLLSRGADPGSGRNEALIDVILNNRSDLVSLLLEKGAPPDKGRLNVQKNPPRPNESQISFLIPGVTRADAPAWPSEAIFPEEYQGYLNWKAGNSVYDGFAPIHLACLGNQPEIVKQLIAKGSDVNALTANQGSTPLELACALKLLPIGELLVNAGAKGDLPAPGGVRLIDLALCQQNLPWYELLKKAGAVVKGDSPCGLSPLEAMSRRWTEGEENYLKLAARVLEDGADPNGNDRFRPVLFAAESQDPELVRLLKAKGADFNPSGGIPPVTALMGSHFSGGREPGVVPGFSVRAALTVQALVEGGSDLNGVYRPEKAGSDKYPEWLEYTALDILAVCLPDEESLNRFLAFKPAVSSSALNGTPFQRALNKYTFLLNDGDSRVSLNRRRLISQVSSTVPGSKGQVVSGSLEATLKSAPATLRRLWEYEKMDQNPEFGTHVQVQIFAPDRKVPLCSFTAAGDSGKGVSLAEALVSSYGAGSCPIPDFSKLEILGRDPVSGRQTLLRSLDLAALAQAQPPGADPMLAPGEILSLPPTDQEAKSWRDFPEPVTVWLRNSLTRRITVKAGAWTRVFKVVPVLNGFRWDPATDVLAVKPTLRTVLRYLPKPAWFYRMESVRITESGAGSGPGQAAAKVVDLAGSPADAEKGTEKDKDPLLSDGTEITLEEIPADDPEFVKRKAQGIFVSSPPDGFLREVFRRTDPPPGLPESSVTSLDALREFYEESECVIPFPDLNSLTFRGQPQEQGPLENPWGGELTVSRSAPGPAGKEAFFRLQGSDQEVKYLKLKMRLDPPGVPLREIVLGKTDGQFSASPDGWVFEHSNLGYPNQPAGLIADGSVSAFTLEAVSARLFGGRAAGEPRWLMREGMKESLMFRPADSPLPFIVLKDGDVIRLDPSDRSPLISDPPPAVNTPQRAFPNRRIVLPTHGP